MGDIMKISLEELKEDLAETKLELACCKRLLVTGHNQKIAEMAEIDEKIIAIIEVELKTREEMK